MKKFDMIFNCLCHTIFHDNLYYIKIISLDLRSFTSLLKHFYRLYAIMIKHFMLYHN